MKRATRQRSALAELLERTTVFHSAQQLHALLIKQGEDVALATVYRRLNALADAGEIDVLRSRGGEARFRRCDRAEHHHHLICQNCGHTVEFADSMMERWATSTARQHGFTEVTHVIELSGLCTACQHNDDQ